MSKLEQFQNFIKTNGEELTGVGVPVVLTDEQAKQAEVQFTFGWQISISVTGQNHGGYRPSGQGCGSAIEAKARAQQAAKKYVSGQDPLFNERFIKILGPDLKQNFLLKNTSLNSSPEIYVGCDSCHNCYGKGCVDCRDCGGRGKSSCMSCQGGGRVNVTKYDHHNDRTVYTTGNCLSCYGKGVTTCSSCSGKGSRQCHTCAGNGSLYASYTIDAEATRSTQWEYINNDYHQWSESYLKREGLGVINALEDIVEVDVQKVLNGCTFIYAFKAKLPTLQFTATIDNVSTIMSFAGKYHQTHNAGAIYDPAIWKVAKKLGSGNKSDDVKALATPAIKEILEANLTDSQTALLDENWVSVDIKDAIVSNYDNLVSRLKKQTSKGISLSMLSASIKSGFIFLCLCSMLALLFPLFAAKTRERIGLLDLPNWLNYILDTHYQIFGINFPFNYIVLFAMFYVSVKLIRRFYWKKIGRLKTTILALACTLLLPYMAFLLFFNIQNLLNNVPSFVDALTGFVILAGLYLIVIGFKLPRKWYLKILGVLAAIGIYIGIQFAIVALNGPIKVFPTDPNYLNNVLNFFQPAIRYVKFNLLEVILLTLCCGYFLTRRKYWLNAKTEVANYNSPILIKSMKMES